MLQHDQPQLSTTTNRTVVLEMNFMNFDITAPDASAVARTFARDVHSTRVSSCEAAVCYQLNVYLVLLRFA